MIQSESCNFEGLGFQALFDNKTIEVFSDLLRMLAVVGGGSKLSCAE